ncbi:MAG: redoxin domain-containing protein [Acidobacteria bacterium]|nr:redoxin domain-containing protein [Acidobacteriota bacterium]
MRRALLLAAVHNGVCGALLLRFPQALPAALGFGPAEPTEAWRWIGLMMCAFGVGYAVAARGPLRHWPIVLVGLASKLCSPLIFLQAAAEGSAPWTTGGLILLNDLVWWAPFGLILRAAAADYAAEADEPEPPPRDRAMLRFQSQHGYSLFELSQLSPTLVIFLRHAGCTFCREALQEVARLRPRIAAQGVEVAFVTMSEEPRAQDVFERYGLGDAPRFSDPHCELYRAFDLRRGSWAQMLAPSVWLRGLHSGLVRRNGLGFSDGDAFRLPGVFLIQDGRVLCSYRHRGPADRPDYLALAAVAAPEPRAEPVGLAGRPV